MKLKVCGMKYHENILSVARLQPDFMGFIFYDQSSRYFNEAPPELPKEIKKTGYRYVTLDINGYSSGSTT